MNRLISQCSLNSKFKLCLFIFLLHLQYLIKNQIQVTFISIISFISTGTFIFAWHKCYDYLTLQPTHYIHRDALRETFKRAWKQFWVFESSASGNLNETAWNWTRNPEIRQLPENLYLCMHRYYRFCCYAIKYLDIPPQANKLSFQGCQNLDSFLLHPGMIYATFVSNNLSLQPPFI